MKYYILQIKSTIRMCILVVQNVPQGQPLLFDYWHNLASQLKRSLPNSISIEFRLRSLHLFRQIDPTEFRIALEVSASSQILVQYAG